VRAPRILVSDEARQLIVREAALYRDVETGGILMGRFDSAGTIHVTHASGPGPNAVHKPAYFMRDTVYCASVLREHYERFGVDYVGEWHTHVDGLRVPSPGDLITLANIMHDPDYDFESFAMLLAVKFRRRRSRLELQAFVATKNLVMQSVVEELETRKGEG
jgi:integrative and conjugative element protein (TIGR02256 family)